VLAFLGRIDAGYGKATMADCHPVAAITVTDFEHAARRQKILQRHLQGGAAGFTPARAVVAKALVPECRRSLAHGATLAAHGSA